MVHFFPFCLSLLNSYIALEYKCMYSFIFILVDNKKVHQLEFSVVKGRREAIKGKEIITVSLFARKIRQVEWYRCGRLNSLTKVA